MEIKKKCGYQNRDYFSKEISEALQEILDISTMSNKHVAKSLYTMNELFDAVLEYEGFNNYGGKIRDWIKEIYGINLNEVKE